jgi:uracil-DNA glycosylase
MDAKEQLRAYLRQRQEAGESEILLDHMTAAAAVAAIRASARGVNPGAAYGDWREALRAAGVVDAGPGDAVTRSEPAPETPAWVPPPKAGGAEAAPPPQLKQGLVVGGGAAELPGGPVGSAETIADIAELVAGCTLCPLYQTAKHPVPGTGDPKAGLMVVGEAPGATEDEQGKPFVGAAGQLLTKILAAIQLSREDVFITNVLKHRPPLNRNPLPHEVQACSPYLLRQLEIIRPKAILALGTFAAQTLLQTAQTIGSLRGLVHRYHGIPLVVTYHPAALLRNSAWKRPTWQDVQLVRRILDSARAGA